jgi:hypothetical protein
MKITHTYTNQSGDAYYSRTDENGEITYSFSESFADYWTQADQDLEALKGSILVSPLQKTETIPQRYFIYEEASDPMDAERYNDLVEVTKETFDLTEGEISTERHTMFTNGCNQICHTKENY